MAGKSCHKSFDTRAKNQVEHAESDTRYGNRVLQRLKTGLTVYVGSQDGSDSLTQAKRRIVESTAERVYSLLFGASVATLCSSDHLRQNWNGQKGNENARNCLTSDNEGQFVGETDQLRWTVEEGPQAEE